MGLSVKSSGVNIFKGQRRVKVCVGKLPSGVPQGTLMFDFSGICMCFHLMRLSIVCPTYPGWGTTWGIPGDLIWNFIPEGGAFDHVIDHFATPGTVLMSVRDQFLGDQSGLGVWWDRGFDFNLWPQGRAIDWRRGQIPT